MFLEKAPDLSLLPTPTLAQSLQGQNGAVLAKLDSRRYMRERIVDILPYRMALDCGGSLTYWYFSRHFIWLASFHFGLKKALYRDKLGIHGNRAENVELVT